MRFLSILFLSLLILSSYHMQGQPQKGDAFLAFHGSVRGLQQIVNFNRNESDYLSLGLYSQLQPQVFISDHTALGVGNDWGLDFSRDSAGIDYTWNLGLGPTIQYLFGQGSWQPFIGAGAYWGLRHQFISEPIFRDAPSWFLTFRGVVQTGVYYWLNDQWALQGTITYRNTNLLLPESYTTSSPHVVMAQIGISYLWRRPFETFFNQDQDLK
ncbi:MAG TPA: hypothetical protein DCE41_17390 [Cytophagales bacterium]|nr:hypothetical protein [Cytophagales bacterium]HAA20235.1 hypothetical protein [Cytophagales bacterium]HAP61769.1 hypothetical protein [Cytophagales bacterium]